VLRTICLPQKRLRFNPRASIEDEDEDEEEEAFWREMMELNVLW